MYFVTPSSAALAQALETWHWIGVKGKSPILVTAFADVFLQGDDGVWFLDSSLEGELKKVCGHRGELERLLASQEARDEYLLAAFVERAVREGFTLELGECYDFKIHPRIGSRIEFENIEKRDFSVTLHIRGQLHDQVRRMAPGTKISKVVFKE